MVKTDNEISVLIVDDCNISRLGVVNALSSINHVTIVNIVGTGEEAIKYLSIKTVNLIFMDLHMPGMGGIEATRRILKNNPNQKIIVLTAIVDEPFPTNLLTLGVSGYLSKGATTEEIATAVSEVHIGKRYVQSKIAQEIVDKSVSPKKSSCLLSLLSEKEIEIIKMIAQGLEIQTIADRLCITKKTVNTYRYRIFNKLKLKVDVELAYFAIQNGLHCINLPLRGLL